MEPRDRASSAGRPRNASALSNMSFDERGTTVRQSSLASERPSHAVALSKRALGDGVRVCGIWISGNGVSLLTSAILFGLITSVQYGYALQVGSVALQADCVSMGVDALAFLGNLFADCFPKDSPKKRRVELGMSGISHLLLLGFTIKFVLDGVGDSQVTDDDESPGERQTMGWVVFGFALGGLLFDVISLLAYKFFGTRAAADEHGRTEDALTFGINTNMCAALLHIISDLARSSTTFVEGIVLLKVKSIPATQADGISTLVVCSIIALGASAALLTWMREVYVYVSREEESDESRDSINPLRRGDDQVNKTRADSLSGRAESFAGNVSAALGDSYSCLCCRISGNGVSLLTSAALFGLITSVQYGYALQVGSVALQADCMSMGVDALAFLGNLFADCFPKDSPKKRRVELSMSGVSHFLLLGFTIKFVLDGVGDSQVTSDDDSPGERRTMGWVVFGFALGGLLFDVISLLAYKFYGTRAEADEHGHREDELTFGINTNMCAALLHVVSDLARSSTTFVEGIILLKVTSIPATRADGVSTLVVCSIIAVGASAAILAWLREVYHYVTAQKPEGYASLNSDEPTRSSRRCSPRAIVLLIAIGSSGTYVATKKKND